MPALAQFNTLSLAISTATQLTIPGNAHYYVSITNIGPGNVFIKAASTVSATDPASYQLLINQTIAPLLAGSVWVLADAAGKISVALLPKP